MSRLFQKILDALPFVVLSRKRWDEYVAEDEKTKKNIRQLLRKYTLVFEIMEENTNNKIGNVRAISEVINVLNNDQRLPVKNFKK